MAYRQSARFALRPIFSLALSTGLICVLACNQQDDAGSPDRAEDPASEEPVDMGAADSAGGMEKPAADVAATTQVEESGFIYKELNVAKDSARTGDGQTITLQGNAVTLKGQEIKVGDTLPDATVIAAGMESVSISDGKGHVRILSVVPALNTPVCEQQTHYLSEKNDGLEDQIELVTISMDPPEVQAQFAQEASIENVTFLSDAPSASFGNAAGLRVEERPILARAVMVVDADNVVRYLQVVPEITAMPDMDAAFEFARSLVPPAS